MLRHFAPSPVAAVAAARSLSSSPSTVGFVGLGKMGQGMAKNLSEAGHKLILCDIDEATARRVADSLPNAAEVVASPADLVAACPQVVSMVPNDAALEQIVRGEGGLLAGLPAGADAPLHVSCSTVSPFTSRALSEEWAQRNGVHVTAPVFARPDGIAARQAYFPVSGGISASRSAAIELLAPTCSETFDFGDDPGAANVVKLSGNYLIAAAIQSIGEAMALSEKNGLDRTQVMQMLSSTIFDCLIYKGYGQRVSERDHRPGGFSLELGLKDVKLVQDTAQRSKVPMPVGSVLHDRWLTAFAKGRGDIDWSATALSTSEDSGIDVSSAVAEAMRAAADEKSAK